MLVKFEIVLMKCHINTSILFKMDFFFLQMFRMLSFNYLNFLISEVKSICVFIQSNEFICQKPI